MSHDHWPGHQTNTIYINRGDWLNVTSRSEWNVAGQLHDSIMQAIAEQQKAVRQMEQWELTEKHYPTTAYWLRFTDDVMLNVNTSTLEWLEVSRWMGLY